MLNYEKISDNLIRIKLVSSVNVQEKKLISKYELDIYFELLNDNNKSYKICLRRQKFIFSYFKFNS